MTTLVPVASGISDNQMRTGKARCAFGVWCEASILVSDKEWRREALGRRGTQLGSL